MGVRVVVLALEHVNRVWRLGQLYRAEDGLQAIAFTVLCGILLEIRGRYHFLDGVLGVRVSLLQLAASLKVGGANGIVVTRSGTRVVERCWNIRFGFDGCLLGLRRLRPSVQFALDLVVELNVGFLGVLRAGRLAALTERVAHDLVVVVPRVLWQAAGRAIFLIFDILRVVEFGQARLCVSIVLEQDRAVLLLMLKLCPPEDARS